MFQFPHLPPPPLCVQGGVTRVLLAGLPHSGIAGALPACGPPALFAACHALHRPLSPRHPPHTVCIVSEIASRPRPGPAAANASLDAPLPRATRDPSLGTRQCVTLPPGQTKGNIMRSWSRRGLTQREQAISYLHLLTNCTDDALSPVVGHPGLEPGTSALSGQRSDHLS